MSDKRPPLAAQALADFPPIAILAFAVEYGCPDCPSEVADIVQTPTGWSIVTRHAETCPDPTTENINRALLRRSP